MTCAHEADLTAHLDRELSPSETEAMAAHLKTCASCSATLGLLERTIARLTALPEWEPSPALRRAVLNRIESRPDGVWASLKQRWWAVPLAAATAAVVALLVTHQSGQSSVAELELHDGHDGMELAANLEVVREMDVLGVEQPDDLEVVAELQELEATP